jgi:hypothetical protein
VGRIVTVASERQHNAKEQKIGVNVLVLLAPGFPIAIRAAACRPAVLPQADCWAVG